MKNGHGLAAYGDYAPTELAVEIEGANPVSRYLS